MHMILHTPQPPCTQVQQYRICNVQSVNTTQDIDALVKQYNTTLHNIAVQQQKTTVKKAKPRNTTHIFSLIAKIITLG